VHATDCAAHAAGADVGGWTCSPDKTPLGFFSCGQTYCDGTEYCWHGIGDHCAHFFQCKPLADTCATAPAPTCEECLMELACPNGPCDCVDTPGNGVVGLTISFQSI
jgi:hypothetical protein